MLTAPNRQDLRPGLRICTQQHAARGESKPLWARTRLLSCRFSVTARAQRASALCRAKIGQGPPQMSCAGLSTGHRATPHGSRSFCASGVQAEVLHVGAATFAPPVCLLRKATVIVSDRWCQTHQHLARSPTDVTPPRIVSPPLGTHRSKATCQTLAALYVTMGSQGLQHATRKITFMRRR